MKANPYNDVWTILKYLPETEVQQLPEKLRDLIRESMDPEAVSEIRGDIPLDQQELSIETRKLLATLYLTYWAKDPKDRQDYVEKLHQNQAGETVMTEEDYQKYLEAFDEWNELFGPIPFWAQSRDWLPKRCYEIISDDSKEDLIVGKTRLKESYVTRKQRDVIVQEAREWTIAAVTENKEVLYWHDNDTDVWESKEYIEDFYKENVIVKDQHFYGALLETKNTSSMGLSVFKDEEYGILLIDGRKDGRTEKHFSHSSDEVSRSEDTVYSLCRKEAAAVKED